MITKTLVTRKQISSLAIAILVLFTTRTTEAQTSIRLGYDVDVSSDYGLTLDPNDPQMIRNSQWKTAPVMEMFRSSPVFRLTNNAEVPIERFLVTIPLIGNRDYLWDTYQVLEDADSGAAQVTNPGDNVLGGSQSRAFEVFFPNGLAPDDSFAIRVSLVNGPSLNPGIADYRTALWDPTSNTSNQNTSNNAFITIDYDAPSLGSNDTLEAPFFDYISTSLTGFDDFNNYSEGGVSGTSSNFAADPGGHMQSSNVFDMNQLTNVVVPEPSAIVLTLLGVISMFGIAANRRRKQHTR